MNTNVSMPFDDHCNKQYPEDRLIFFISSFTLVVSKIEQVYKMKRASNFFFTDEIHLRQMKTFDVKGFFFL